MNIWEYTYFPGELIVADLHSKDFQVIKIQNLLENEKIAAGIIHNPNKDKLKLWVGTTYGRVFSIEKGKSWKKSDC